MEKADLIKKALEVQKRAHAPYSKFSVGCALEAASGKIYMGCNVENASYGATICAERSALVQAVSSGDKVIKRLAIVASSPQIIVPCGICLQTILEFGPEAEVICCSENAKDQKTFSLKELLPQSFGPRFLSGQP